MGLDRLCLYPLSMLETHRNGGSDLYVDLKQKTHAERQP
jgi:hypothetical protein